MPEHSVITDPNIHEPKGISTALANEVYSANGAGTGSWNKIYTQGWEDIADAGAAQNLTSGAWVDLQNDGTGANSNSTYRLPGKTIIWDVVNDEFDFAAAGCAIGDVVNIRIDVVVTTSGVNHEIALRMDLAHGDPAEYSFELMRTNYKTAGTHAIVRDISIYLGNTKTLNNPAKIAMRTDNTGDTVVVNGWFVRTIPINPVLA